MEDDDWLDAAVIHCPNCGTQLYRVIHSPYCDDHRLYCDSCPRAVEVSYYDANYRRIVDSLGQAPTREDIMVAIEPLLKKCVCGGRFHDKSQRRCFACGTAISEASSHDLSPYTGCEDSDRDPTDEEQAAYDRFEVAFIERQALWS